ncbi:MAG TPA: MerR family transcriptional regulator [Gemmatimonadaceae bacterium]
MPDTRTFTVGEFARLGAVTPRTLRHYHHAGVLSPAEIDPRNGYWRYGAWQLARLYEVLALARAGLTLAQIRELARSGAAASSLEGALVAARRDIEARLADERARLAWVDARLAELRDGARAEAESTAGYAVRIKRAAPVRVATLRDVVPSFEGADALLDELAHAASPRRGGRVGRLGGHPRGAVWHDCGKRTGVIDCETVIALGDHAPSLSSRGAHRRVRLHELPAATVACVVHCGPDDRAEEAYVAARRWMTAHGYRETGPNREWYLGESGEGPVTEIQFPVAASVGSTNRRWSHAGRRGTDAEIGS